MPRKNRRHALFVHAPASPEKEEVAHMVTELSFEINERVLVVSDEFMQIDIRPEHQLIPVPNLPADRQPALIYLASLGKSSQRTMWDALMLVAGVLTAGQCNPVTLP